MRTGICQLLLQHSFVQNGFYGAIEINYVNAGTFKHVHKYSLGSFSNLTSSQSYCLRVSGCDTV
jgi:hypothetical protein